MVALGIFALGIGGVLAMFMGAAATHRRALDETVAAIVAEGAMAEVRAGFCRNGFVEPVLSDGPEPAPGFPLFSYRTATTVLEREPSSGRAVQAYVEVTVIWQRQGNRREEVYRTILFRE